MAIDQSKTHSYMMCDWIPGCANAVTAKVFTTTVQVASGTDYKFNGTTDGNVWWCGITNSVHSLSVKVSVKWDGNFVPFTMTPNDQGNGCNILVHATSATCTNDADCDGSLDADDCNDADQKYGEFELETSGDAIDYDCDGFNEPNGDAGPALEGTLTVFAYAPDQAVTHAYQMCDWKVSNNVCPIAKTSKVFVGSVTLNEGQEYVFNGTSDGQYWCSGTNTMNTAIATYWNYEPVKFTIVPNPQGTGCNFKIIASDMVCTNDADCDGSLDADDCSDLDPEFHPGQVETSGDLSDFNCDGKNDPISGGGGVQTGSVKTLQIWVYDTDQSVQKTFTKVNGGESPFRSGGWNWNMEQSLATSTINNVSKGALIQAQVAENASFVFNGLIDGNTAKAHWFCQNNSATVLAVALFDGKVTAPVKPKSTNNAGQCNLEVIAKAGAFPVYDADGDGYFTNASGSLWDCDDANQMVHPNNLETFGDTANTDCKGGNDPDPYRYYTAGGWASSISTVQLIDESSWTSNDVYSKTYPMSWNAGEGGYVADVTPALAPLVFRVRAWINGAWVYSSWKTPQNTCTIVTTVRVKNQVTGVAVDKTGSLIPPVVLEDWCHQQMTLP